MKKLAIKIIKRKDGDAARGRAQNLSGQKCAAGISAEKNELYSRRKMADTISKWIAERRENKRSEEKSTFRTLFGDEFLSGRAV